ncbi:MAG: 5-oxoprolinase [Candidatus Latescibacteria bacterium]|nr:5-oxoprolinase [Candidatus Latescibacterota bacterium]NIO29045.1 5-oxoprolinase [Candidatus Latescibacterota bacterium]NIO56670.1 5-oxoprolinase [Candidatus Latescibacterota bacterium]NIT02253.1 5-oxoprolinase [Candidatus Latescibacterota bacterium]NIT39138.1 5-oxoprolinase [Candidatus Latescibacterota bacterium]
MNRKNNSDWKTWIDTGGTFTDCVALDSSGNLHREKVLSSSALRGSIVAVLSPKVLQIDAKWKAPADFIRGFKFLLLEKHLPEVQVEKYDPAESTIELKQPLAKEITAGDAFEVCSSEEAPILAARLATATPLRMPLPPMSMRLGTTRGTNALLERRGAPIALFITRGFGDLLSIGNQQRPDLFALGIRKPEPLYQAVIEVPERIAADGTVLEPLGIDRVADDTSSLVKAGIRCAAVAFMHSYINPEHEQELADYLFKNGFDHVSCSSNLAPFIKILPRAETAVVDAYLAPVIDDYLDRVQEPIGEGRLHVMTSAGGMVQPSSYHAKDSLLSGPAGGVVGGALAGRRSDYTKVIAFDMGGTSTDVARFDGDFDYVFEHEVGDAHLVAPALAVESVASGGGSICRFDGLELHVGPESAGASPGPACYGAGGPLTLTDVNLLLGRLDCSKFEIPIDIDAAGKELDKIIEHIEERKNEKPESEKLLEGFLDIANERMADAIRRISIRKGYDPKDYALVAFGGAGAQHACAVAEKLGVDTIVIPQDASLLSALGLGYAAIERFAERQVLGQLADVHPNVPKWIEELGENAITALEIEGVHRNQIDIRRRIVSMRFAGQDSVLQIEFDEKTPLEKAFETKYKTIFGHWQEERPTEVESIRVVVASQAADRAESPPKPAPSTVEPDRCMRAYFDGSWQDVPAFERDDLPRGAQLTGPALIFEQYTMTVVETGWSAEVDGAGAIVLRREKSASGRTDQRHPEIVRLELFTNRFGTIAREMGEMLRRTAISTNVKERLDFSCAVLDKDGELVVNAPHIPVHLGAIGICVRAMQEILPMAPGDVVITNHPKFGGSHLPDITVVTPVHLPGGRLLGYVANRAHHAELGGAQPGSLPPTASTLADEGVVIPPMHLFEKGKARWEDIERVLATSPFPSRAIRENLADLRAAVAANRSGAGALLKLAEEHGEKAVWHYMEALKKRAESKIREALRKIPDGTYEATEQLDDGSPLRVKIGIAGDEATIDFTGSADLHPKSFNATPAVVNSVVIYVLRLLVDEPLPLNEGLMRAIKMHIPQGMLNPPFPDDPALAPAVVGGNVETSQRLVDTLLKALGIVACSQGTMNNVVFGTDRYSYYETVCGGTGAGPTFDGTSAVHSHMTNTRITDPEIVEHRYPVRVERFGLRKGSGGAGRHRGGDGAVREIAFLDNMSLSVLGQHRESGPYGLAGGAAGKSADHYVLRTTGETVTLASIDGSDVNPGDRMILKTPGGGGYGSKED